MKIRLVVVMGALCVIPHYARAEALLPPSTRIGVIEGIVDFCGGVDPKDRGDLKKVARRLNGNLSEKDVEKAEKEDNYRMAYNTVSRVFQGFSADDARQFCHAVRH